MRRKRRRMSEEEPPPYADAARGASDGSADKLCERASGRSVTFP